MTVANEASIVQVEEVDPEEGMMLFGRACQERLGVSAEEFLTAHATGAYPASWDPQAVSEVEFLLPFAR